MAEEKRHTACKDYEEADKSAKDAWERIKKAHKKKLLRISAMRWS